MRVHKGEVLTIRLKVEDPEASQALLGPLMGTILPGAAPHAGVVVTGPARGDAFEAGTDCNCPCCDCDCERCNPNDDFEDEDEDEDEQDDGANYA